MRGTRGFASNAITDNTYQSYYLSIMNNYHYQKAIHILLDAFRYPSYDKEIIEKEIQPINSEFYISYRSYDFLMNVIIGQLSNKEIIFNGFACGNNETLKPSESEKLSKILKQYHMKLNRPEKLFFVFHSNLTINESEEYIKNNFNYKMHEFLDNEIDVEYKKVFEDNINNLQTKEIFDEDLYEHGIYYCSSYKSNILNIFFHIGLINYKEIEFDLIDYYSYLFNSKSLLDKLKEKEYILEIKYINAKKYVLIGNNNVMKLEFYLTEKGLNELDEVLLIIYKYIDIMKNEGFQQKFFYNYIKYKQNLNIKKFKKYEIIGEYFNINNVVNSYRLYGENQIFTYGIPREENYNEDKLKKYLNNIKYEKSFFVMNTKNLENITTFLESITKETIKYYNSDFILGKFPNNFKNRIINNNENLQIRKINNYFSEKNEKVIPCYEHLHNDCKELNEFDFEKEDKYNPTLLNEENKNFVTYYQIDKSSESYTVSLYLQFNIQENELILNDDAFSNIEYYILNQKTFDIDEFDSISISYFYDTITIKITCFSDNVENILKNLLINLQEEPKEFEYTFAINEIKNRNNFEISLNQYTTTLTNTFINEGKSNDDYNYNNNQIIESLKNETFDNIKELHKILFNSITSTKLKIAGNINLDLVQNVHNIIKDNIKLITNSHNFKIFKTNKLKEESPFIINYYEKSNLVYNIENAIMVVYKFDQKYSKYKDIFLECFLNTGFIYLRFNYSNTYGLSAYYSSDYLYIYEHGRYKEVTEMEDDINKFIKGMLDGSIQCENYKDIIESYNIKMEIKEEKTYDRLVNSFFYGSYPQQTIIDENIVLPDTFSELIKEISPIFTYPRRYTILLSRSDMPDKDFKNLVEKRTEIREYIINPNIKIEHTQDIYYMKNRTKD